MGYDLDPKFFGNVIDSKADNFFAKTLAGALILNPIAAGFAGLSLIFALLAWLASSRISEIVSQPSTEYLYVAQYPIIS